MHINDTFRELGRENYYRGEKKELKVMALGIR